MVGRGGPSDVLSAPALAQRWSALDGCPGPPVDGPPAPGEVQRAIVVGCAGGTVVELVRIDGGGHVWPAGPTISASHASAEFFASRP